MLRKIIAGGQTGADRGALDAAIASGVDIGGWCPAGRRAEDGRIPKVYPLTETISADYSERTRFNVRDSDGTLVIADGEPAGGTALAVRLARLLEKPVLITDCTPGNVTAAEAWVQRNDIHVLNVAGPRASESTSIYACAYQLVAALLAATPERD